MLKPFIFLDRFEVPAGGQPPRFGMHPHSGIATLTYLMSGRAGYEDTAGEHGARGVLGFRLWVAMPPALELAEAHSLYLGPDSEPHAGPVRVLPGAYQGKASPIPTS